MDVGGGGGEEDHTVVRDGGSMVNELRKHWEPIFAAKRVDEAQVAAYIHTHMPKGDLLDLDAPSRGAIRAFLRRARASAPGPDC